MNIRNKIIDPVSIDEVLQDLRETDRTNNPYQFHKCDDRNIILIGRTRTGKSTIADVVNDIAFVSKPPELYSETRTVQFKTISTDTKDNIWYYFNFIDVPGFFDISINGKDKLSNEKIKSYLQECMTKNITNIHMFAFVFNLAGGINDRDIDTMIFVKTAYPNLAKYMALVITHCEQLNAEQRKKLIDDFYLHPKVIRSSLKDYFKLGPLFMGCIRHESVTTANDKSVYYEYNNILDMRSEFIGKCISSTQPFNIYHGDSGNTCRLS